MADREHHLKGVLNGSLFYEQPHIQPEVQKTRQFIAQASRVLVEVGFDHGRRLTSMARLNPGWHFLGLEIRKKRVEEALERAHRDGLHNMHPWRMDARAVFAAILPKHSIDIVEVLFPTPWWDPALRAKRRLIQKRFIVDVMNVLKPGGHLYIATDVLSYADAIHEDFGSLGIRVSHTAPDRPDQPRCQQLSRREWRCEQDQIPVYRWWLIKDESNRSALHQE